MSCTPSRILGFTLVSILACLLLLLSTLASDLSVRDACPKLPEGVTLKGKSIFLSSILRNAMVVFPRWRLAVERLAECIVEEGGFLIVSIWSNDNADGTAEELLQLQGKF